MSELNIGIREIFRIVIPGGYAFVLFEWLREKQSICEKSALLCIAVWVLVGLLAYGLQVHKRWQPYKNTFIKNVKELGDAIKKVANDNEVVGKNDEQKKDPDPYKDVYKYFLEKHAPETKERIHYFSSFYYMLAEMSLISAIAAFYLIYKFFADLGLDWRIVIIPAILSLALQLFMLYRDISKEVQLKLDTHPRWKWIMRYAISWIGIILVGLFGMWIWAVCLNKVWPNGSTFHVDWRFFVLLSVAFVFGRLAAMQWKSVISEQIILVKDKKDDLNGVIRKVFSK